MLQAGVWPGWCPGGWVGLPFLLHATHPPCHPTYDYDISHAVAVPDLLAWPVSRGAGEGVEGQAHAAVLFLLEVSRCIYAPHRETWAHVPHVGSPGHMLRLASWGPRWHEALVVAAAAARVCHLTAASGGSSHIRFPTTPPPTACCTQHTHIPPPSQMPERI